MVLVPRNCVSSALSNGLSVFFEKVVFQHENWIFIVFYESRLFSSELLETVDKIGSLTLRTQEGRQAIQSPRQSTFHCKNWRFLHDFLKIVENRPLQKSLLETHFVSKPLQITAKNEVWPQGPDCNRIWYASSCRGKTHVHANLIVNFQ